MARARFSRSRVIVRWYSPYWPAASCCAFSVVFGVLASAPLATGMQALIHYELVLGVQCDKLAHLLQ